jgi:hypothetical protein
MSDEQAIALAHWRRLLCRMEDQDVPDRTAKCITAMALLVEDTIAENPCAMQERARVLLALMDPRQ